MGLGPVGRWELMEALEPDLGRDRRDLRKRRAEVFRQIDNLVRRGRLTKVVRFKVAISAASSNGSKPRTDNRYQHCALGWGALPQERVRLVKCAAARMLGRLRRGVQERKSEPKAAAVRINGLMPPRPGSRPRGRPRLERQIVAS